MMKAGTYWVGDLCYVLHEVWDEFCNLQDGEHVMRDGRAIAFYGTEFGDGTYYDREGRSYDVDAGLIGCILLSDINLSDMDNETGGGHIVEFTEEFSTGSSDDPSSGYIWFGHVGINTGDEFEDDLERYEATEFDEWRDFDPDC